MQNGINVVRCTPAMQALDLLPGIVPPIFGEASTSVNESYDACIHFRQFSYTLLPIIDPAVLSLAQTPD